MRLARIVLAALALLAPAWTSQSRAENLEQIFNRGNTAYEQGRYDEAVEAYRSVLRYRVQDPVLEFNLANAEFKLNNLGPAILHYERAHRMDPTDDDIRSNLDYARSFCLDRVEIPEQSVLVHWLQAAQNRLGSDGQAWIAAGLIWLGAGLLAWRLSRPAGWSGRYGWLLALLLISIAVTSASCYHTSQRLEGRRLAVVQKAAVEVLAGPSLNNPALFTVHEGLTLEVRTVREGWLQVSLPNGLNGWIDRTAIEIV
jgi:tetratricopeptide (TPR) repeat protein